MYVNRHVYGVLCTRCGQNIYFAYWRPFINCRERSSIGKTSSETLPRMENYFKIFNVNMCLNPMKYVRKSFISNDLLIMKRSVLIQLIIPAIKVKTKIKKRYSPLSQPHYLPRPHNTRYILIAQNISWCCQRKISSRNKFEMQPLKRVCGALTNT